MEISNTLPHWPRLYIEIWFGLKKPRKEGEKKYLVQALYILLHSSPRARSNEGLLITPPP